MPRLFNKLKSLAILSTSGFIAFNGICIYKGNDSYYREIFMPLMHQLVQAETAHSLTLKVAKLGFLPKANSDDTSFLNTTVCGMTFSSPIGLAGGFDKDAEVVHELLDIGFGFVEVGSITPLPQAGNDRPRIFRLSKDKAVINRCGFNSKGHDYAMEQLKRTFLKAKPKGIIGVNLGKNKLSESPTDDYVLGVKRFAALAHYLVINVSSPNTPGLRNLQEKKHLENIIDKVLEARNSIQVNRPAIFVKISPDVSDEWKKDIATVVTRKEKRIDGLIISNTTLTRPASLESPNKCQEGGLSGMPLRDLSTKTIHEMYSLTKGQIPIIGVGGVFTGEDAYNKIKAGASLIQIYTALVYEGPTVIKKIKTELEELLKKDSYSTVAEAVGVDHKK